MRHRHDRALLNDLIAVLEANPAGLRRWSVMRAMRTRRERAGHEITLKFEDEIERLFREYCVSEPPRENETRPFFKPKEKARRGVGRRSGAACRVPGTRARSGVVGDNAKIVVMACLCAGP